MMDTSLNSLDGRFRPIAVELLAQLTEQRLAVLIVNTRRTAIEQAAAIARGVSWVAHSKHEDGLAIDIAPYDIYALHGDDKLRWNLNDPVWMKMGIIGEAIRVGGVSLRWGGRFTPLNGVGIGKDPGHFEYSATVPPSPQA